MKIVSFEMQEWAILEGPELEEALASVRNTVELIVKVGSGQGLSACNRFV
jgi:hypothetical protein